MNRNTVLLPFLLGAALSFGQSSQPAPSPDAAPPTSSDSQSDHHRRPGVAGTITAVNADSLTVKTMSGQTAQVNVTDKTEFRKDRQPAKLADFKVGDQIFVRGQAAGENTWQADMIAAAPPGGGMGERFREGMGKQFIVGQVTAMNGTQLTIQRPDNVSQTITVDESTSFKKGGESITLADFKVGDHVFGRGEMKNDVFVPSTLNVGEPRMGRGQGRGPGPGQGDGQGAPPPPQ